MKAHRNSIVTSVIFALLVTAAAGLALAAAGSAYTAAGYITSVPYEGAYLTNTGGQVLARGNIQIFKMDSADARLTGRRVVIAEVAMNTDGSATLHGTASQEVGTWNVSDPQNPKFTPGTGYWDMTWSGTRNADGSMNLAIAGLGHGGIIEGLRLQETMTRAAGPLFDPAVPYNSTGTITPAPASTTLMSDDFTTANYPPRQFVSRISGAATWTVTNGRCVINAKYNQPTGFNNTASWLAYSNIALGEVDEGKTVAMRIDVVSATGPDMVCQLGCLAYDRATFNATVGRDYVHLCKTYNGQFTVFFVDRPNIPLTNVVLSLAFTRRGENLHIAIRILEKGPNAVVLYEKTVIDTPASDPCLIGLVEFEPGVFLPSVADPMGTWTPLGMPYFGIWQTTDGTKAAVTGVFDNFTATTGDIPPLKIQKSVLLTWPDTGLAFQVEATPSLSGPTTQWRPVTEPVIECNGMKQVTIPLSSYEAMEVYRLK